MKNVHNVIKFVFKVESVGKSVINKIVFGYFQVPNRNYFFDLNENGESESTQLMLKLNAQPVKRFNRVSETSCCGGSNHYSENRQYIGCIS